LLIDFLNEGFIMLPILICQFYPSEGAGYFSEVLDAHQIPWKMLRVDLGEAIPKDTTQISALVMMGGPMSVNDDLPWIPPLLALIRQAQDLRLPILGHCLGGQLIAKALGASIRANPVKEIGWGLVSPSNDAVAQDYFGEKALDVFHWHGETFDLPEGATCLISSPHCANQAFSLGNTLAMQCHIEMTSEMVRNWCMTDKDYLYAAIDSPAVQTPEVMQDGLEARITALHLIADRVYQRWLATALV